MIPLRLARELSWQLGQLAAPERQARVLARAPVVLSFYESDEDIEFLERWQELASVGIAPEAYLLESLSELRSKRSTLLPDALKILQGFFETRAKWDVSIQLLTELLEWSVRHHDPSREMQAHRGLSSIFLHQGEYAKALDHGERTLELSEALGDLKDIALALGNLAIAYEGQGRFDEALPLYRRHLEIAESMGDRRSTSRALGNLGVINIYLGNYDEAFQQFSESYTLSKALGDTDGMDSAIGNQAYLHSRAGRKAEAIACCEEGIELARSLGNLDGVARGIGNLGLLYQEASEFEEANASFRMQYDIAEAIGNKVSMMRALGNIGNNLRRQGRFAEALSCHERGRAIAESIGDPAAIHIAVGNIAAVYFEDGNYAKAFECYHSALLGHRAIGFTLHEDEWNLGLAESLLLVFEESIRSEYVTDFLMSHNTEIPFDPDSQMSTRIATLSAARHFADRAAEIAKPDTVPVVRVLSARLDAAEGKQERAVQELEVLLAETTDEERAADLCYWLWSVSHGERFKAEALARYESLWQRIPKFEFRKRIAELRGEAVPRSADEVERRG